MQRIDKSEYAKLKEDFLLCCPMFEAIGNSIRLAIVAELITAGEQGLRVGELQKSVHLSRPAVSHHLKVLMDAGVIRLREEGTMNFYYLCIAEHLPIIKKMNRDMDVFLEKYYGDIL